MIARQPTTNPFRTSTPANWRTFLFLREGAQNIYPYSADAATREEALAKVRDANPRITNFVPA